MKRWLVYATLVAWLAAAPTTRADTQVDQAQSRKASFSMF